MTKPFNVTQIKGNKGENPLKDAINEFKENLDMNIEYYNLVAKLKKEYFDSLKKEGFSDVEALELVKTMPL